MGPMTGRRANRRRSAVAWVAFVGVSTLAGAAAPWPEARAGPAIGQFEIKTLNVVPGQTEFQSQNAFSLGNPRRDIVVEPQGEIVADDNSIVQSRYGLELERGFTPWLKARVGIEFEKERVEEPRTLGEVDAFDALRLDEYALESIVVLIPRRKHGFALGLIVEYEHPADGAGARTISGGPIVEWISGPWIATFNPVLIQFFGGEKDDFGKTDDKIDFGYAARIMYRAADRLSLAVESYGTVERLGTTGSPGEEARLLGDFNQFRAGPVVYWKIEDTSKVETTLGIGALLGLNPSTPDAALKLSLEVEF